MFGRRKSGAAARHEAMAAGPQRIRIDAPQGVLYDGALTAMPLPDALIIELSIEFFDDPEPCQIHRGAVLKRVFMDITLTLGENSTTSYERLPDNLRRYLSGYAGLNSVTMYRGEGD